MKGEESAFEVTRRRPECAFTPETAVARAGMGSSVVVLTTVQVAGRTAFGTEPPSPTCIISRIAKDSARAKVPPAGTLMEIARFGTCGAADVLGRSTPTRISLVDIRWSATPFFRPDLAEWA
jgi:hypothetical protein